MLNRYFLQDFKSVLRYGIPESVTFIVSFYLFPRARYCKGSLTVGPTTTSSLVIGHQDTLNDPWVLGVFRQDASPVLSYGPPSRSLLDGTRLVDSTGRETKRDNLCAWLTQVPRYFGSCHKISVLTTHARIQPRPADWNWKIPGNSGRLREREEPEREKGRKIEKPQISPSTARANALLMNPLIALIVLINDFSNKPAALINITFFRKLMREWLCGRDSV